MPHPFLFTIYMLESVIISLLPSPVDAEELARESSDVRENVRRKFLVDLPEDFYQFWEFCKMLNPACPEGEDVALSQ